VTAATAVLVGMVIPVALALLVTMFVLWQAKR